MTIEQLEKRIGFLEIQIENLEKDNRQQTIDTAYLYIHSNWNLIRWYLGRDRDRCSKGSSLFDRINDAEEAIRARLSPNLRLVQFSDSPMETAYNWRIETTVTLNRYGFTFFD